MSRKTEAFDVVVIGAGASGFAAAAELARHRRRVCLLEARDRLGGRILTRHEPNLPVPLEGAEFVHGLPQPTLKRLAERNTALIDAPQTRWLLRAGKLQPAENLFDELRERRQCASKVVRAVARRVVLRR